MENAENVDVGSPKGYSLFCFPRYEKHLRNYIDKSILVYTPTIDEFLNDLNNKNIFKLTLNYAKHKAENIYKF